MPFTKKVRKALSHAMRDFIEMKSRGCVTEQNAQIRAKLDECTVDGKIGVILSGRDCDCQQYYRERVQDGWSSVAAFKKKWDEHCGWLDGPESQTFVKPSEINRENNWSRDLALEAYEDGHPHVIYV